MDISQPPPGLPTQAQGGPPASVFQSGKMLLLLRQGLPLPTDRCFKCNAPATVMKRKNLSWHHPSIYLGILAGLLVYIILAICLQKKASVEFGLCEGCNSKRKLWITIWTIAMLSVIPLIALSISQENGIYALVGVFTFFAGAIGLLVSLRLGFPKKIDDAQIVLAGSCEEFRRPFPQI